ncbi:tRNA (adenine(22)-N(1))-methyltransferase [Sediminibacillus albus]|uniref:tRNA (Adenine22-N1)-methyltransferase n=1 Tax=Sediminibacillus albus TaxID=407036 RepID=A0A1G9CQY0_9BACI|nr:tRNA (adenine(22)-N(1))-methyltransferase TrmK [Sediminibacillus albus]SDK54090.1 tRNA (adenine22-N1)-methyltransferase [Sediminibacillus albus]
MNGRLLSDRLKSVASFLPEGAVFADIGSDHAYLPVYVCRQDQQALAIAGELNEGPFQSAKRNVEEQGLSARIAVRKGNGLSILKANEVEQVVIAGMGGSLITDILENGKNKLSTVGRIITQPNLEARSIRVWLQENGYKLIGEDIIEEAGHIYEVLAADKSEVKAAMNEVELLCGPFLLKEKSMAFINKWESEIKKRENVVYQMRHASSPDKAKIDQFKEEIEIIKGVLA